MTLPSDDLSVGTPVEATPAIRPAPETRREGTCVTLRPVDPARDVDGLYAGSHGRAVVEGLWTYMAYGPFEGRDAMRAWLETCARSADPLFLTVHADGHPAGMASFMNVVPGMRRLELGHIWYVPGAQRTRVNTETVYLMLRESFDALGCRRVEWKCDALNARSRAAARRLGFRFEGIFRSHMIVKGRSRDTAWYAMTDEDWPAIRANLERWLSSGETRVSLAALNAPLVRATIEDA